MDGLIHILLIIFLVDMLVICSVWAITKLRIEKSIYYKNGVVDGYKKHDVEMRRKCENACWTMDVYPYSKGYIKGCLFYEMIKEEDEWPIQTI